jgi:hypothetical protein
MPTAKPVSPMLAALRCWVQGRRIYLEINNHRSVSFPASKYAALENASQTELEKIRLQEDGRVVLWESLNEVIQVDDVANNRFIHTPRAAAAEVPVA